MSIEGISLMEKTFKDLASDMEAAEFKLLKDAGFEMVKEVGKRHELNYQSQTLNPQALGSLIDYIDLDLDRYVRSRMLDNIPHLRLFLLGLEKQMDLMAYGPMSNVENGWHFAIGHDIPFNPELKQGQPEYDIMLLSLMNQFRGRILCHLSYSTDDEMVELRKLLGNIDEAKPSSTIAADVVFEARRNFFKVYFAKAGDGYSTTIEIRNTDDKKAAVFPVGHVSKHDSAFPYYVQSADPLFIPIQKVEMSLVDTDYKYVEDIFTTIFVNYAKLGNIIESIEVTATQLGPKGSNKRALLWLMVIDLMKSAYYGEWSKIKTYKRIKMTELDLSTNEVTYDPVKTYGSLVRQRIQGMRMRKEDFIIATLNEKRWKAFYESYYQYEDSELATRVYGNPEYSSDIYSENWEDEITKLTIENWRSIMNHETYSLEGECKHPPYPEEPDKPGKH
jgi:hypothetical protein